MKSSRKPSSREDPQAPEKAQGQQERKPGWSCPPQGAAQCAHSSAAAGEALSPGEGRLGEEESGHFLRAQGQEAELPRRRRA